jgi:predicted Zn-dependent protease
MAPKIKGFIWVFLAFLLAVFFAFGLGYFARLLPWSVEQKMAFVFASFESKRCSQKSSQSSQDALSKILMRLYPVYPEDRSFPLDVSVIPGETVNAFAYLGGKIFVYEGLLKKIESPEEFAGIIAHEIEHVKQRHVIQGVFARFITSEMLKFIFSGGQVNPQSAEIFLNLRFSVKQEEMADRGALQRLKDSRVDVSGFQSFFKRDQNEYGQFFSLLSDHPSNKDRAQLAEQFKGHPVKSVLTPSEWLNLKKICEEKN